MIELLTAIPSASSIPFLLRRGSPVLVNGRRRVVSELLLDDGSAGWVADLRGAIEPISAESAPSLDLTDPTGRAHAAVWMRCQHGGADIQRLSRSDYDIWIAARDFDEMTPTEIDTFARMVLRLAGRNP